LESAKPIAEKFNVPIETEEQIIEPSNIFEGKQVSLATVLKNPKLLTKLFNPLKPSWGEPFEEIKDRMVWAMRSVWDQTATGEVVMVSHQLPIWMVHRFSQGERLAHDPRSRRCELSSVTSFVFEGAKLLEVDYQDPAHELRKLAIDSGAV
jgi:broad specificity phosphatase PhoE